MKLVTSVQKMDKAECAAILDKGMNELVLLVAIFTQSSGAVEYTDCFSAEGKTPPSSNECPGYETKQSDGEVPVMLEFWGMWSTPSLSSLPGQLWPGVVAEW